VIPRIHERWNRDHLIARGACDPRFFDGADVIRLIRDQALHWPYFSLVNQGVRPPLREFSLGVRGAGQRPIVPARAIAAIEAGSTVKLQRLEDFESSVRAEVAHLQREFHALTTCYVFLTPAQSQGLAFHRDASHVLVVQVEGTKRWSIVRPNGPAGSDVGPVDPEDGERIDFTLEAGDVLYLPHGWPHCAVTDSGRSTHLTFTLCEPDPAVLAGEIQLAVARKAAARSRAGRPVDLAEIVAELDPKALVSSALERHGL
jgi:hypothetical protein